MKVPGVERNLTRSRDPSGGGTGPRWLRFQPAQRTPRRTPLSSTRVDSPEVSQRGRLTPRHAASVNDSYPVAPVRIVRHIPRRCPVCRLFCWWWGWQQPHRGRAARPALPPRGSPLAALPVWPPDPCGRISDVRSRNSWWRCPKTGVARGISSNPLPRPRPPGPRWPAGPGRRWITQIRSGGSAYARTDDTDTAATIAARGRSHQPMRRW